MEISEIRRPSIFECDKKQTFTISDGGEFVDNIYREQESSVLFGKLIGRNYVEPHVKKVFSNSDIVCEGYLHKKGSWMKNWKRRYFILRKDIRALCYFPSREDLTLLGSIPLDIETQLSNVQPQDADGFENVVLLQTEGENGLCIPTYIRFENFNEMKSWIVDINNEAHNINPPNEEQSDLWTALFDEVQTFEFKSLPRRDAQTGSSSQKGATSQPVGPTLHDANISSSRKDVTSLRRKTAKPNNTELKPEKGSATVSSKPVPIPGLSSENSNDMVTETFLKPEKVLSVDSDGANQELSTEMESDDDDDDDYGEEAQLPQRFRVARRIFGSGTSSGATAPSSARSSSTNVSVSKPSSSALSVSPGNVNQTKEYEYIPTGDQVASDGGNPTAAAVIPSTGEQSSPTNGNAKFQPFLLNSIRNRRLKMKALKAEKILNAPPYEQYTADRFETHRRALSGLQISLRLRNVCGFQDKIFAVLFARTPVNSCSSCVEASKVTISEKIPATNADTRDDTSGSSTSQQQQTRNISSSHQSKWTLLCRTEVQIVKDRPEYGENYVHDCKIYFCVLQDLIPEHCKEVKIVVFRLENDMNPKEPSKASNLHQQLEIARTIVSKKLFDIHQVLKVSMQVKVELPMDIAIPLFKESEVILGVVRMTSYGLYQHRSLLASAFRTKAYSEIMYSFASNNALTLSVEQLYASRFSVSSARALLSLWHQERFSYMNMTLQSLREDLAILYRELQEQQKDLANSSLEHGSMTAVGSSGSSSNVTGSNSNGGTITANNLAQQQSALSALEAQYENFRVDIEQIEDMFNDSTELENVLLDTCDDAVKGNNVVNNIIDSSLGGAVLRRSTWKKVTAWQYCTTNLNIHLLLSKQYPSSELLRQGEAEGGNRNVHCVSSITLGCPAAHELKYHDGGLRRLFGDIVDFERRLEWMQAIQSPDMTYLKLLCYRYPKDASILFGQKSKPQHDLVKMLKKKFEIGKRIDICSSQALGCAVTVVKLTCALAAQIGGKYKDILVRSLKIGFLIMFESMLSTQGDEVGMIEDLSVAAQWLSLVTIRLVSESKNPSSESKSSETFINATGSYHAKAPNLATSNESSVEASSQSLPDNLSTGFEESLLRKALGQQSLNDKQSNQIHVGDSEGIHARRDASGILIIDVEVSEREGSLIKELLAYMKEFETVQTNIFGGSASDREAFPYAYNPTPQLSTPDASMTGNENPTVYAVTELIGIVFTQGVNEMQTLANLSSSRDVLKQAEINTASFMRMDKFYQSYRLALQYQLSRDSPELIDSIQTFYNSLNQFSASTSSPGVTSVASSNSTRLSMSPSVFASMNRSKRQSVRQFYGSIHVNPIKDNYSSIVASMTNRVLSANDKMRDQLFEAIQASAANPFDKHVAVLLRASELARTIVGTIGILCKSGKDRTSMGVTLEHTKSLVEDLGVLSAKDICQVMRLQGVRRMNVYANTGQCMYAFNQIQRIALPNCYRPPVGSHSRNVVS